MQLSITFHKGSVHFPSQLSGCRFPFHDPPTIRSESGQTVHSRSVRVKGKGAFPCYIQNWAQNSFPVKHCKIAWFIPSPVQSSLVLYFQNYIILGGKHNFQEQLEPKLASSFQSHCRFKALEEEEEEALIRSLLKEM